MNSIFVYLFLKSCLLASIANCYRHRLEFPASSTLEGLRPAVTDGGKDREKLLREHFQGRKWASIMGKVSRVANLLFLTHVRSNVMLITIRTYNTLSGTCRMRGVCTY